MAALQRLTLAFLIAAEHHRIVWWVEINSNDVPDRYRLANTRTTVDPSSRMAPDGEIMLAYDVRKPAKGFGCAIGLTHKYKVHIEHLIWRFLQFCTVMPDAKFNAWFWRMEQRFNTWTKEFSLVQENVLEIEHRVMWASAIAAARELKEGRFEVLGSGIPGASLDAMFRSLADV